MELLERIAATVDEISTPAQAAYRKLVIRLARNEGDIDETAAAKVLREAHKSPDDLSADIHLLNQRERWVADIAAYESAKLEAEAAERRVADLSKQRRAIAKKATAKINAEIAELQTNRYRPAGLVATAIAARQKLLETSPLAGEMERFRENELRSAARHVRQLREHRTATRDEIGRLKSERSREPMPARQQSLDAAIKTAEGHLSERSRACADAERELERLNAKHEEMQAAALKA